MKKTLLIAAIGLVTFASFAQAEATLAEQVISIENGEAYLQDQNGNIQGMMIENTVVTVVPGEYVVINGDGSVVNLENKIVGHIKEVKTEGGSELQLGTRKGENVATWNVESRLGTRKGENVATWNSPVESEAGGIPLRAGISGTTAE